MQRNALAVLPGMLHQPFFCAVQLSWIQRRLAVLVLVTYRCLTNRDSLSLLDLLVLFWLFLTSLSLPWDESVVSTTSTPLFPGTRPALCKSWGGSTLSHHVGCRPKTSVTPYARDLESSYGRLIRRMWSASRRAAARWRFSRRTRGISYLSRETAQD